MATCPHFHVPVAPKLCKRTVGKKTHNNGYDSKEGEDTSNEDVHVLLELRHLVWRVGHVQQDL